MEASPKIFIGQVPLSFGEDDLKPLVEQFGKVIELKIIRDSATGNSRGEVLFEPLSRTSLGIYSFSILLCLRRLRILDVVKSSRIGCVH